MSKRTPTKATKRIESARKDESLVEFLKRIQVPRGSEHFPRAGKAPAGKKKG